MEKLTSMLSGMHLQWFADAQDPKPAEDAGQQQEVVKKMIAEAVAEAVKPFLAQQEVDKAEKAGLDRKNNDLEKEKEAAAQKAAAESGTWQEANASIRAEMEAKDQAAAVEKAADAVKLKKATWKAVATKLRLSEETFVDPSLSAEDGEKYLIRQREAFDVELTAEKNADLSKGWKPGSGNIGNNGGEPDRSKWTQDDYNAEAQKEMEAGMAG